LLLAVKLLSLDGLNVAECGGDHAADYIEDVEPLVNKYVSVPRDYGSLNCAAFIAGVIHGVLLASGFVRACDRGLARFLWPCLLHRFWLCCRLGP